eukprot:959778-Pyramimonas_sp.AAC.2
MWLNKLVTWSILQCRPCRALPPLPPHITQSDIVDHAGGNRLQLITFSGGGVRRRQVVIGARRVDVTDYELITKYQREVDSSVEAYQRSVVYLQPQ